MRYSFQPRRKLTAEETAANAARKAARDKAAMTCQCCARPILANNGRGRIAHHGYERPYEFYQTASCMGAREEPFEVSRDVLGTLIGYIGDNLQRAEQHLAKLKADTTPVRYEYTVRSPHDRFKRIEKSVRVTRAWFKPDTRDYDADSLVVGPFINSGMDYSTTYETLRKREIVSTESFIRATTDDLKRQRARFDGWKQTHKRVGNEWKAV